MKCYTLLISTLLALNGEVFGKSKTRQFPTDFLFGVSTAAYQIEGGWQEDGKTPSIWDTAAHTDPSPIVDESTGDVAADSYHRYKRDIQMVKELNVDFYRFSISWPRILPNGFPDKINQPGIDYYNALINELLQQNIAPMVTIYHWDLPCYLQKLGGWTNPMVVTWFVDFAKVLFEKFGDRVKHWITINEPKQICVEGYGSDLKAPMVNMSGIGEYMCIKNVLLAHARAYRLYDEHYRKLQGGTIGIAISFTWHEPASPTVDDQQAAFDANMFEWGQYVHPIFSKVGDYPEKFKNIVALKSAEQGYPRSRLLELTAEEVLLIRGSSDILGVNTYTTKLTYRDASLEGMYPVPSIKDDMGAVLVKDPTWTQSSSEWLQEVPWGFYKLLMEINKLYDNPPVYITENGWSGSDGLLDEDRIHYYRSYLNAMLDAIDQGCDIRGYSAWSLMDAFEWRSGYTEKFGLYQVDFSSPEQTRTPRKSAFIYKEIAKTKVLDPDYEPESFIVEVSSNVQNEEESLQ